MAHITYFAEILPARLFLRIERSAIVNLDAIRELRRCEHGDYIIHLHDKTQLKLSQIFRTVWLRIIPCMEMPMIQAAMQIMALFTGQLSLKTETEKKTVLSFLILPNSCLAASQW